MRYSSRVLTILNHPQISYIINFQQYTANIVFICETTEKFNTEEDLHIVIYPKYYTIKSTMLCNVPGVQVWKLTFQFELVINR